MSKFKLVCEDEDIPLVGFSKITHEFNCEGLGCIITNMTNFLQGCGYLSVNQQLDIGRNINLDEDLDEFTESLFNNGAISGTIVTGTPIPKE